MHLYIFRTTFSTAVLRKTEKANLFLFIFNSLRAQLNEWKNFTTYENYHENSRVKPRVCSPAVDGNEYIRRGLSVKDAGNYSTSCKVRNWRILTQVITREFCYFSQHSIHCVHIDTGVLCDEVGHLTPFFTTNKSNQVEGTVTKLRKSRYHHHYHRHHRHHRHHHHH